MDQLAEIIKYANNLTPLGVAGILAIIVYILVQQKKNSDAVDEIGTNHMHEVKEAISQLHEDNKVIISKLDQSLQSLEYLKARINGHSK